MNLKSRPIILISNSSWYLLHYRKLLIKKIRDNQSYPIALCPHDKSSLKLSELLIHIPWNMKRAQNQNLFSGLVSFMRMLLIVRAIKPKLIHSHTLQANFLSAIVSSFFGTNCILSFAGFGRFAQSKFFVKKFFLLILKIIYIFSCYERKSKFGVKYNPKRCTFIFQNFQDLDFIKKRTYLCF